MTKQRTAEKVSRTALIVATMLSVHNAYAGRQSYGAIPAEVAQVSDDARARFTCELAPFDLSQGLYCYGPYAIRAAYGVDGLIDAGLDGTGQTIVILDAYGSPFAQGDLEAFDSMYGLPDPPSFKQIYMPGAPPFDPTNGDMVGWTAEIALDTQWSHAMAPGANIVLIAAAGDNDEDLIAGLNYAVEHYPGRPVSMSFGRASSTSPAGPASTSSATGPAPSSAHATTATRSSPPPGTTGSTAATSASPTRASLPPRRT
jgi:subtilase family serine protease